MADNHYVPDKAGCFCARDPICPRPLAGSSPGGLASLLQSCSTLLVITDTSSPWTSSPDNNPGQPVFPLPAGPFLTGSQPKHVPCFVPSPSCHCESLCSALPSHLSPDPSVLLREARALCSSPAQRPFPSFPLSTFVLLKALFSLIPLSFSSPRLFLHCHPVYFGVHFHCYSETKIQSFISGCGSQTLL